MTKIRWTLREVMARYNISGQALAKELQVSTTSISKWKNRETMPRINGEKAEDLANALTKLAGKTINFTDLLEESQETQVNFNQPVTA